MIENNGLVSRVFSCLYIFNNGVEFAQISCNRQFEGNEDGGSCCRGYIFNSVNFLLLFPMFAFFEELNRDFDEC